MKKGNVLFLFLAGSALPLHAMWYKGLEQKEAHKGDLVYIRMKPRLETAAKYTCVPECLREQLKKLNSDKKFISVDLYERIQTRVQEIEKRAAIKGIRNDRLPIVDTDSLCDELYDELFDDRCLEKPVVSVNEPPEDIMVATQEED